MGRVVFRKFTINDHIKISPSYLKSVYFASLILLFTTEAFTGLMPTTYKPSLKSSNWMGKTLVKSTSAKVRSSPMDFVNLKSSTINRFRPNLFDLVDIWSAIHQIT